MVYYFYQKKNFFFKKFRSLCRHYGFSAICKKFIFSDFEREFYCRSNKVFCSDTSRSDAMQ